MPSSLITDIRKQYGTPAVGTGQGMDMPTTAYPFSWSGFAAPGGKDFISSIMSQVERPAKIDSGKFIDDISSFYAPERRRVQGMFDESSQLLQKQATQAWPELLQQAANQGASRGIAGGSTPMTDFRVKLGQKLANDVLTQQAALQAQKAKAMQQIGSEAQGAKTGIINAIVGSQLQREPQLMSLLANLGKESYSEDQSKMYANMLNFILGMQNG